MNILVEGLILVGIIVSFPISIILFVNDKSINSITRLLAIAFFSISCYALSHFFFLTKLILQVPAYYRLVTPLYYLIPPCIYLYVKQILRPEDKMLKPYWMHFLPAIIMAFDVIPWITIGAQARYEAVFAITTNHQAIFTVAPGYIPIWVHFVARPLLGMIYLYFQFRYIYKVYVAQNRKLNTLHRQALTKWVITLTIIELILYLSVTAFSTAMWLEVDNVYLLKIVYVPAILMCVSFIIIAFYLYLNPLLLYGSNFGAYELSYDYDQELYISQSRNVPLSQRLEARDVTLDLGEGAGEDNELDEFVGLGLSPYTREAIESYRHCLEREVVQEELFKRQGLTVHQLTKMCDLPARALSFMLTHVYKKRFNDFINEYRINYVVQRLHDNDWRGLTLEGLALEAGFSSRTTFFLAFKKIHQMSPSQYLNNLEKQMYRVVKG